MFFFYLKYLVMKIFVFGIDLQRAVRRNISLYVWIPENPAVSNLAVSPTPLWSSHW